MNLCVSCTYNAFHLKLTEKLACVESISFNNALQFKWNIWLVT